MVSMRRLATAAITLLTATVSSPGEVRGQGGMSDAPARPTASSSSPQAAPAGAVIKIGRVNLQRFPTVDVDFSAAAGESTLNGLLLTDLGVTVSGSAPDSVALNRSYSAGDTAAIVIVADANVFVSSAARSRQLMLDLAARMAPHDQIAFVLVGDSVEAVTRTSSVPALASVLPRNHEPVYAPVLWRGIDTAMRLIARGRTARRHIVLFTESTAGDVDLARVQVASRAQGRGIVVHTVALSEQADLLSLKLLASETRGTAHVLLDGESAHEIAQGVTAGSRTSYMMSFTVPVALREQRVDMRIAVRTPFSAWDPASLQDEQSFVATARAGGSDQALDGLWQRSLSLPWLAGTGIAALLLTLLTGLTYVIPGWTRARTALAASALASTILAFTFVTLSYS